MIVVKILVTAWAVVFVIGAVIWHREASRAHQEMKKEKQK